MRNPARFAIVLTVGWLLACGGVPSADPATPPAGGNDTTVFEEILTIKFKRLFINSIS